MLKVEKSLKNKIIPFAGDLEALTKKNGKFRKVLYTMKKMQIVLMSLKPGEDIGMETHGGVDQFVRIESGNGMAIINGNKYDLRDGIAIMIPAGSEHNIMNTYTHKELKLYTIYSPPEHVPNRDDVVKP